MKDPRIAQAVKVSNQYPWRILRVYPDGERGLLAIVTSRLEAEAFVARMKRSRPYNYVIEGPA